MLQREYFRRASVGHVQQIRFNDVELREDDIERGVKDPTDGMLLEPRPQHEMKIPGDCLMLRVRRRCHVVLPVDQLVPPPVVREQQKVVVGELQGLPRRSLRRM